MITSILGKLSGQLKNIPGTESAGSADSLIQIFGDGIPTFYFQLIVGIYVVQIVYILTVISNGIQNGADSLSEKFMLGNNMVNSSVIYCCAAAILIMLFNII